MKIYGVRVAMICMLSSMIVFNWQICVAEEHKSATSHPGFRVDGKIVLSSMVALTDGHISKMVDSLEVLTLTEEVKSLSWEKMRELLATVQKNGVPSTVWFARSDGSYYTVDKGAIDKNLKDRDYFPKVMAGEKVIGTLVISRSTGKKSSVVAVPIRIDGKVSGMLGASIFLDGLSIAIKQEMNLPKNVAFYAIDEKANTILSWKTDMIFKDPIKQANPSLSKAIEGMLSKKEGMVEYMLAGKSRKAIFQTSPLTGWWLVLGVIED